MKNSIFSKVVAMIVILTFTCTFNSYPLPSIEEVVSGDASVTYTYPNTMVINASNDAIVNYSSFDIGVNEKVVVNLPSVNSEMLNRVLGGSASQLLGGLSCNGVFILVNSAGIYVGPSANIDVGSLILSTRDINNADFLSGNHMFQKITEDQAEMLLLNEGNIKIHDGGFGVLIAGAVENKGIITAPIGKIVLASGDCVRLDISGGGLISIAIDEGVASSILDYDDNPITDQIKNSGVVEAAGGVVILKAESIGEIFEQAINLQGIARASTINIDTDGNVVSLGTVEAETVFEKGASFKLGGSFSVGETWMDNLDGAVELVGGTIGGYFSDYGDIIFSGNVTLSGDTTLYADDNHNNYGMLDMDGYGLDGAGFNLSLYSGENTTLGDIADVSLLELNSSSSSYRTYTSPASKDFNVNTVKTNYHAGLARNKVEGGYQLIYSVSDRIGGLQYMDQHLSWDYKLANNIDAGETSSWSGGSGFDPVGYSSSNDFRGKFDGDGHVITDLYINRSSTDYVGLFGRTDGAEISNIGLVGGSVRGDDYVGALVGFNDDYSSITTSYATGNVTGDDDYVGGLVGRNEDHSSITCSYATGNVTGDDYVGGLVGYNDDHSSITTSFATGNVTGDGSNDDYIGGLVGYNYDHSSITNCYARGSVTGDDYVGGLVGYNRYDSTIKKSYATGYVSGDDDVGGLLGYDRDNHTSDYQGNFWDRQTSGISSQDGGVGNRSGSSWQAVVTGKTTSQMKTQSTFTNKGWDFTNIWGMDSGVNNGYPTFLCQIPLPSSIIISGMVNGLGSGVDIFLALNGIYVDTESSGASGTFIFSDVDVAVDDHLLIYVDTSAANLLGIVQNASSDITGLSMQVNSFAVGDSDLTVGNAFTNTDLSSAWLNNSDVYYSVSGGNATFTGGLDLWIPQNITYAPGGDVNISGGLLNQGTFTLGSNDVTFNGSGSFNITSNSALFNDLTFAGSGSTWTLQDALSVDNDLIVNAGTLDANSSAVTVNGSSSFTVDGASAEYKAGSASLTVKGDLIIEGGGTFDGESADVDVNGDVKVNDSGSSLTAPSGFFKVAGNWLKSAAASFISGSNNTVTFDGSSSRQLSSGGTGADDDFANIVVNKSSQSRDLDITDHLVVQKSLKVLKGTVDVGSGKNVSIYGSSTLEVNGSSAAYEAGSGLLTISGDLLIKNNGDFDGQSADIDVNGDVKVESGGDLTAPSGFFRVAGDWLKSSSADFWAGSSSNTVTFDGSGTQELSSGGTGDDDDFQNILVAKSYGSNLNITQDLEVDESLKITSGTVNGGNSDVYVYGDSTLEVIGEYSAYNAGSDSLTVSGDLIVKNGGTFDGQSADVDVGDNVKVDNGTFRAGNDSLSIDDNLEIKNGGTFDGESANVDVDGDVIVENIGSDLIAPSGFFKVAGDWLKSNLADFWAGSGIICRVFTYYFKS